jgi:hypothetical protein
MTAPLWLLPLQEETGGSFTGGAPTSAHTDGSFPGDTAITVPPQRLPQHAMYLPEPSWPHALPWWLPPRRWSPLAASSSPPADTSCGRLPPPLDLPSDLDGGFLSDVPPPHCVLLSAGEPLSPLGSLLPRESALLSTSAGGGDTTGERGAATS